MQLTVEQLKELLPNNQYVEQWHDGFVEWYNTQKNIFESVK